MSGDERAQILARVAAGEIAVVRQDWGNSARVWFGDGGQVWLVDGGDYLGRLEPVEDPSRLPPAIVEWAEAPAPPDEPALLRARSLLADARTGLAALAGGDWFWQAPNRALAEVERLGALRFRIEGDGLAWVSRTRPLKEIGEALWRGGEGVGAAAPTAAERAILDRALSEVSGRLDALRAGGHLLGYRSDDGARGYLFVGGRWMHLRLTPALRLDDASLFNPWRGICDEEKALDVLLEQLRRRSMEMIPLPPALQQDHAALAAALRLPKEAIVRRYLDHIQSGGTISGGPTTDQSWTVRWDGDGYTISSYRDDGEGLRPVTDPLAEAALRKMLTTYHMFGLHRMDEG